MNTRILKSRWMIRSIGFVIFGILIHRIGPSKLWGTILSVDLYSFLMAIPIFFIMMFVKTIKMRGLMRTPFSLRRLYSLNAFTFSVGSITPGRIGEFSKIIFLSRFGISVTESLSVTLIDRFMDVFLMICCAAAGMFVFFGPTQGWIGVVVVISVALLMLGLLFSDRVMTFLIRGKWMEIVRTEGRGARSYIYNLPWSVWFSAGGLTILYLGLYFLQMWVLVQSLDIPGSVGYTHMAMAVSTSAMPAILPISIGNIGPRDAILILIFSRMGWGAENGMAFGILILALFLMNGLFGLFFFPRQDDKADEKNPPDSR